MNLFSAWYGLSGDFKHLTRRTASDKVLGDKAFNISNYPKYNEYQRGLSSMVYKFFHKKFKCGSVNNEIKENERLAEELHKPTVRKLKKKEEFILHLKIIFGELIYLICN